MQVDLFYNLSCCSNIIYIASNGTGLERIPFELACLLLCYPWPFTTATAERSSTWCASCSTGRTLSMQKMFIDVMAMNRAISIL